MTVEAWHFVGDTLRNGRPVPPDGKLLRWRGQRLVMCPTQHDLATGGGGLHASRRVIDALKYAPGDTICRVRCGGKMITGKDKLVCRRRTILWRVDGENLLREFARKQALSVAHLWDMPDVVRRYLETGDDSLRADARIAAEASAQIAPRGGADAAKWGAADAAAWAAAGIVSWNAAWAAADSASWGAADAAATRTAAWDAAKAAAWDAAWDAADKMLEQMVMEARQ